MVGGGSSTLSVSPAFSGKSGGQLQWKESRGVLLTLFPCHSKKNQPFFRSYVSFRTLTFQLLPNAFARGLYEAIEHLQQSAMESILSFGNFWKLT